MVTPVLQELHVQACKTANPAGQFKQRPCFILCKYDSVSDDQEKSGESKTSYAQNTSGLGGSFAGVYKLPCNGLTQAFCDKTVA